MNKEINVLYIEDNEDYIDFVNRAVRKNNPEVTVNAITDGQQVLDYLAVNDDAVKKANLILLDIHMPGIDGIELLKRLRKTEELQFTPVIMFSTSDNPADVKTCYSYGANAYVVKPIGIEDLSQSLRSLFSFWLNYNFKKTLAA